MISTNSWPKLVFEPGEEFDNRLLINLGDLSMYTWALIIAGTFTLFALCLSSHLLRSHLSSYNNPNEQKWLIGIILMVPVYSVTSFLSLWKPRYAVYIKTLGECYEAFALYSFGRYLIACLGEEEMAVTRLAKQGSDKEFMHTALLLDEKSGSDHDYLVAHPVPLKWCLDPWRLGRQFYDSTKFGIVQYIIIKVLGSWAALMLEIFNKYGEGDFDFSKGYPYITVVQNFSQLWALYCLVKFYQVTKHELHEINPLAKFLCFKAVVFVTWWQGVVIALLFTTGIVTTQTAFPHKASDDAPAEQLQTSLQNFIICIEMAIAAVAHIYVYPATPYQQHLDRKEQNVNSFDSVMVDEIEDLEIAVTSVKDSIQDVVIGGGGHVVEDVRLTVSQAAEPVETGITKVNKAVQKNVVKMNETLQEKGTKLNETFHKKVQQWDKKREEKISKEGTYIINDEEEDDPQLVETKENVRVEHGTQQTGADADEAEDSPSSSSSPRSTKSMGYLKKEVSGLMTSSSMKGDGGGEKICYRQQKERSNSMETNKTSAEKERTNAAGEREQLEERVEVREQKKLDQHGEPISKETNTQWVGKDQNGDGDKEITKEYEETKIEEGERVVKDVKKKKVYT